MKSIFFGTPEISVDFLEQSKKLGFLFDLIITNPDQPKGRKRILSPSPVKNWAIKHNIKTLTPEKIDDNFLNQIKNYDLFFVLAYGKILPKKALDIPKYGTINLHPSLLPKYRGPSPIISAILDDQKHTGISLMLLDEKMDHGPILKQEKIYIKEWKKNRIIEHIFATKGAYLFLKILDDIKSKKIKPKKQNDSQATFCSKFTKKDMELSYPLEQRKNFLKYCAFPKPFFFDKNKKRIIVTSAKWENKKFIIKKIIPEGKKERKFLQ